MREKIVVGFELSIWWGNTLEKWVNIVQNNNPGIIGVKWECFLLQWLNSVPCSNLEIQTTPPWEHLALTIAMEPILVVTLPWVDKPFKSVIDVKTYGIVWKIATQLDLDNENITNENLNPSSDIAEYWWNICHDPYDILTCRVKPSTHGQLTHYSLHFGMLDEFHWKMMRNSLHWRIVLSATFGLNLEVKAMLEAHSLFVWSCHMI